MSSDTAVDLTNTVWIAKPSKHDTNNLMVFFLPANTKLQLRPCIVQTLAGGHSTGTVYGVWAAGSNSSFAFTAGAVSMLGTHTANGATANGFGVGGNVENWTLTLDTNPPKTPAWPS